MTLDEIAAVLEGMEGAIIRKFADRCEFRLNEEIYAPGKSGFSHEESASLFEIRLRRAEEMEALFGRYESLHERPYTQGLPQSLRKAEQEAGPCEGAAGEVRSLNLMPEIVESYLTRLRRMCRPGSDSEGLLCAGIDVAAVQVLGRRIHYGAFYVAERKYRDSPDFYDKLVRSGDREAVLSALTRPEVEEKIVRRVREKAERLAEAAPFRRKAGEDSSSTAKIFADEISFFYRDVIFPLTKKGEVLYLFGRFQKLSLDMT